MTTCKNCFTPFDGRTGVKCHTCQHDLHEECAIKEDGTFFCDVCYTVKAETPAIIEWELPDHIRRTYIETYRTCPFKFLEEVLKGEKQPPTCYTQIGIDLHELFEQAIHDRNFSRKQMESEFKFHWNQYTNDLFESEQQKENMKQRSIDSMDTFYHILPNIPMPFATEQTIHYSIGDDVPLVEFTMDLITENSRGNLDMHDWKTGQVMVGQKISSDLQAPIYIYGVQKHFNRQVDSFTFYYLKDNKTRVFERIDHDNFVCRVGKREYKINLTDTIREVKGIFTQIKKGNFNIPHDTRKMYFACKMCHIQKAGKCQGADQQAWALNR